MKPLSSESRQLEWAAANFAYNLDFIPDDKLDWKPAPTASSALEIVHHILSMLEYMETLEGKQSEAKNTAAPTTREDAKVRLVEAANRWAETMRSLNSEELTRKIDTPFGTFPLSFLATMPVTDIIHHHGQIAYIQTLLGDTESHFDMSLIPK